jgi:chloramphenicol 3-O phosphotransferase
MTGFGTVVVLNGPPRSGKTSLAAALQEDPDRIWLNIGVDAFARSITPKRLSPGIGLRPGGERPEIEAQVADLYAALYEAVASWSRAGRDVVVDVGHHDAYSRPLRTLERAAVALDGLPAYLIGVRCPPDVVVARRLADPPQERALREEGGSLDEKVERWESAVHAPGLYDLEVDTSILSPSEGASSIAERLGAAGPKAFQMIRSRTTS